MAKTAKKKSNVVPLKPASVAARREGVYVGTLVGLSEAGALVELEGQETGEPIAARATVRLTHEHLQREVALMFEQGDPTRPIVTGLLHEPTVAPDGDVSLEVGRPLEAFVDGERISLTAAKEIVLRCGEASIVLTEEGRVIIKGVDVVSRAARTNKIKGGTVRIN